MNPAPQQPVPTLSPFWPIVVLAASIALVLGWNLAQGIQLRSATTKMLNQQELVVAQAQQAENKLKVMMEDLIVLAKTDDDAATIVKKYQIQFNPPPQTAPPAPKGR